MKEEFIKNSPLFAELSEEEQRSLGKRMRLENYTPGEALFVQGGESDALYLIKEGWVKLSTTDQSAMVANLGPGSLLGEADFFLGRPHTMTAKASGQVTVWSLDNQALAEVLAERPEIGLGLGLAFGTGIVQYHHYLLDRLADNPLLKNLSDRERRLVIQHLAPQRYFPNDSIYRSNDPPTGLFFIAAGTVRLLGDSDEDYAELGFGEVFGEMAVISGKSHSNTAQAATEVVLWQLSPADFARLSESSPSIKTNLSRNLRASLTASDQTHAQNILKRIHLFADLPPEALSNVTRFLLLRHVPAGEIIFGQGDPGDAMYIVDSGAVEAISETPDKPREVLAHFAAGDFFGETALLIGKTRSFTTYATSNTNLWCLYRTDFDNLLVKYPQLSVALSRALRDRLGSFGDYSTEPHLKKFARLGGLSRTQLDELSARLQPRRYQGGSTIYYEGRSGDEMYFIEKGQVEHWATTMQGPMLLETLQEGDFFGEIALLSGKGHPTTAYAVTNADIWALTKADFDDFLARYPNLGLTLSRVLSERLEETMNRLRGGAPQRGLPATTGGPAPQPGFSRPIPPASPQPSQPYYPHNRPTTALPPVPVRPVLPPGSRPMPPVRALPPGGPVFHSQYTQAMPPVQPSRPGPPIHAQHTQPVPPVGRPQQGPPSVHSQHTQAVSPVPSARASRPVQPVPPGAGPKVTPAKPKRKRKSAKPKRKQKQAKAQPPVAAAQTPSQPVADRPSKALPPPKKSDTGEKSRPRSAVTQPRVSSNRKLDRRAASLSIWFAKRSLGAKLRILAILLILIWLCGIMAPSWIIQALAATFEDDGALPGDERSIMMQVRQDGAVGAVAALPFVETVTPTPTETSTPTITPTPSSTPTETPIPTLTHTPTNTPTPTDTPTPVFTPTPTDTPTPRFTNTPGLPTDTPTPEATPTPNVDFRLMSVRQLTPCENQGKHHIFIKVQDATGQGINGVPVKIQWSPTADGSVVAKTDTKTNLEGQLDPGRIDFAMFKGTYEVQVQGGTSEVASGITPDYGVGEACGENAVANSLFHISFEVIFQRTY